MTESLPECEAGCDVAGLGDMVDFVRQWAQVRRSKLSRLLSSLSQISTSLRSCRPPAQNVEQPAHAVQHGPNHTGVNRVLDNILYYDADTPSVCLHNAAQVAHHHAVG